MGMYEEKQQHDIDNRTIPVEDMIHVPFTLRKHDPDYNHDSNFIEFGTFGRRAFNYQGVITVDTVMKYKAVATFIYKVYVFDRSRREHHPVGLFESMDGVKIFEMKFMDPRLLLDVLDRIVLKPR